MSLDNGTDQTHLTIPDKTPMGGSLLVGFLASLCCGGTLVFGAIGLGGLYGALPMSRYIPEALAIGGILIALINWSYYNRKASKIPVSNALHHVEELRRTMVLSTFLGLAMMAVGFTFMEWLNHAVVNADRFMTRPRFSDAIIPGVPNLHLLYVSMTFVVLPVVYFLPLARKMKSVTGYR